MATAANMAAMCSLPRVSRLSRRVIRVMGDNPSPMTLGGTNTYLVGLGKRKCLIDTGEGFPGWLSALQEAIRAGPTLPWAADVNHDPMPSSPATAESSSRQDGEVESVAMDITDIVLTHWHRDHVGGVAQALSLYPRAKVWKLPSVVSDAPKPVAVAAAAVTATPLATSQRIFVDDATTLVVIPTPGHTDDHVCLMLVEEGGVAAVAPSAPTSSSSVAAAAATAEQQIVERLPRGGAIFTGDCVLGAGSSVFADFCDFMQSLRLLQELQPSRLYPGHGPVVLDGGATIKGYIEHRLKREQQILDALLQLTARVESGGQLTTTPNGGDGAKATTTTRSFSVSQMVERVYTDTPRHLFPAAAVNVGHHLAKLWREGRVVATDATTNAVIRPEDVSQAGRYEGGEEIGGGCDCHNASSAAGQEETPRRRRMAPGTWLWQCATEAPALSQERALSSRL